MKLLYITTIGRTMHFFKNLIRELLEEGHTVDIATNENNGDTKVPDCYREWGCKVFHISCSRSPIAKGNLDAVKEIKKIVTEGQYEIVHCHTPIASACTRFACHSLRKNGLKVFYTSHGYHFYKGASIKNWFLYFPIEWLCSFWTDTIITINQEDYVRTNKCFHAKRVFYVPGVGIDLNRFSSDNTNQSIKKDLQLPQDVFLLVSVGELNKNKNHSVILRAVSNLNDKRIHYLIAGRGEYYSYLESLSEELNIKEQVHLLGYRDDIFNIYSNADVCVFPSIREGFGLAAVEGMACGLPLVVSDNRGIREFVTNRNGFICRFDDVKGFSDAIRQLQENKELRISMGETNKKDSKAFDVNRINAIMKDIYELHK